MTADFSNDLCRSLRDHAAPGGGSDLIVYHAE